MKLLNKTISYYLLISIPLLVLASFYSYFAIKEELRGETDEALAHQCLQAEHYLTKFDTTKLNLSEWNLGFEGMSTIQHVSNQKSGSVFSDTSIYNDYEKEVVPYRMLRTWYNHENKTYLITLVKTSLEEEDLVEGLFSTFILIIIFLLLAFFIMNWWLSKKLWKPFYTTLENLSAYEVKNHVTEQFGTSSIQEFNLLNETLNKMTHKIHADFLQQKEFTENASHEMQTPLAIIKANIGLLMQSPSLKLEEMNQLQAIDDTTKKLSFLNKALLLLSKIDNNQFNDIHSVDIREVANGVITHLSDLVEAKNIVLENKMTDSLLTLMNPELADVLLGNLFQNAIRHNSSGGLIRLEIKENELILSNSGEPLKIEAEELFTRFKKNEASKESLGLGLAIVKSICSLYAIRISYTYLKNLHSFTLKFNSL